MEERSKQLSTNFVVMPREANHYGNIHGGQIVLEADNLAYTLAAQYSRKNVVTARISEWNFIKPVKVGDLVIIHAEIVRVGRSSMDLKLTVCGENLKTGDIFDVADAQFTMVAVDNAGKPTPVSE